MTVVKYSLTINTVKENIHKHLFFSVNTVWMQNTEFFNPNFFPILTLKITPQTVLFNDEDFHSVEILETVVRQSEMPAHKKKWLLCKVTPVSIQAFLEGQKLCQAWNNHSTGFLIVLPYTTIGKSHSCGDKRCKCCRYMQHSSLYTNKVTGKRYKLFCTVNCKSANVIYILECSVCGLQYVGESKHPFHKCLK